MGLVYVIGCASIAVFALMTIAANVLCAAVIDCDSRPIDWWLKTTCFLQAVVIMGLLVYFLCKVI